MDGRKKRRMDGWKKGRMEGWVDGWKDAWMEGWIVEGRMNGQIREIGGQVNGRVER